MKISVRGVISGNYKLNSKVLLTPIIDYDTFTGDWDELSIIDALIYDYNIDECKSFTNWLYKEVGTRASRRFARKSRLDKANKVKVKDLFIDDDLPF